MKIRKFYWEDVYSFQSWLKNLRFEINNEISLLLRRSESEMDQEQWDNRMEVFRIMCESVTTANNFFNKTDICIERYLRSNAEFSGLRELRLSIMQGFKRIQVILGSGEKSINTIHRAEETVNSIEYHLERFAEALAKE